MLLPEDVFDPPLTDEDLEAYFEREDTAPEEWSYGEDGEPVPLKAEQWSVCDTGSAEWAMRKLAHAEAAAEDIRADARRFKEQIERWAEQQLSPHKRTINFFTGQLEAYARRKREEDGLKSLNLPSGQVTSRLNPARPEIPKDAKSEFIDWACERELPLVRPKWEPVMDQVKKAVTFERVRVPDFGDGVLRLQRWPDAEGEPVWVALPPSMSGPAGTTLAAEDLPNFHDEVWPICNGERVPGVVQVPAEVTYTIKPAL